MSPRVELLSDGKNKGFGLISGELSIRSVDIQTHRQNSDLTKIADRSIF
jgi:hypothetical protein